MVPLRKIIRVASGRGKADLLIKNGRVIDLFSGQIEKKNVAVFGGMIAGFGDYEAIKTIDVRGDFLCPGLIDGHVHIESSMVTLPEFARAVLPRGTTTVVIDPHEIANVLGVQGIRFMAESAKGIPLNVSVMVPSCVPATPLETSGAVIRASDVQSLLKEPWALGLAEMMNFPGVLSGDAEVLRKIEAARGKRIDGHAPSLSGKALSAYIAVGIRSDHECTTAREAKEKLKNGMWIMIREGTTARNLKDLLPLVNSKSSRRFLFVTDDRHPKELLEEGHIDSMVRRAIEWGTDPIDAIQMATINAAQYFHLDDIGAIAPGYRADIIAFESLRGFEITKVFKDGKLVAQEGEMVVPISNKISSPGRRGSLQIKPVRKEDLAVRGNQPLVKVIQVVPDQIVTRKVLKKTIVRDGVVHPDVRQDVLKIVVVERHHATGSIGIGFVRGFGLNQGAIGSTVAHDSHNLVIVGTSDSEILKTIEVIQKMGGGLAVVSKGSLLASLALPIAGLMTPNPVHEVKRQLDTLLAATKTIGCRLSDPFMALSFLSLPVIPELKITDKGLVDVTQFKIVSVFGEN